jgi:hypothetical protein
MPRRAFLLLAVLAWWPAAAWTTSAARATEPAPAHNRALHAADWSAIKKVIADQRSALKAGDAAKAFSYATPGIRSEFRDPAIFIGMVRTTYSALLTARYVEFLEGAVIDGAVIQPLRLVDTDNTVRVALYIMEKQDNGAWRIGGCRIAPSMVQAA